jgi:integrase
MPGRVKEKILGDAHPMRRAVSCLSYAGLGAGEIHRLGWDAVHAEPPKLTGTSDSRGLTYDQAGALLASVEAGGNLRDFVLVEMGLVCGLRQIELRRVRLGDIHPRGGRLFVSIHGKGGARREVFVPKPLQERIERLVAGEGRHLKRTKTVGKAHVSRPLFQSYAGHPLSEGGTRKIINRYLKDAAKDASPHGLRHTCVTWLLNTGATLEQAMEIVGHSEASSHELYAAVDDGWFIGSWQETHPIAKWGGVGIGHVRISGKKYDRRMSRGTERVVPLPMDVVEIVRSGFHEGGLPGEVMSQKMLAWIYNDLDYNPSSLRRKAAIHMAENGAHPFTISLVLGVTPGHVIDSRFERRGQKAEDERVDAVERAVDRLYGHEVVDLEIRSA